jgi:Secretion system C-terminal sorting domain
MKNNYIKMIKNIITAVVLLVGLVTYSQDIHFTFANAQNTNDGSFDYYEVDVMIQTINTTGTFKLGSGQLYFNYSTAAFGTNIFANSGITVTQPNPDYICGQFVDAVAAGIYYNFTVNDNTTSRVSWAFSQFYGSVTFAADNITETLTKLCHLKFKYIDVNEAPMVFYEEGGSFDDQFFTACGPDTGGILEPVNCGANPGIQLLNDTFDSNGATLSDKDFVLLTGISLYPNPTKGMLYIDGDVSKIRSLDIFSITGQHVMSVKDNFNAIDISNLDSALYFVKLNTTEATGTFKIIRE